MAKAGKAKVREPRARGDDAVRFGMIAARRLLVQRGDTQGMAVVEEATLAGFAAASYEVGFRAGVAAAAFRTAERLAEQEGAA